MTVWGLLSATGIVLVVFVIIGELAGVRVGSGRRWLRLLCPSLVYPATAGGGWGGGSQTLYAKSPPPPERNLKDSGPGGVTATWVMKRPRKTFVTLKKRPVTRF